MTARAEKTRWQPRDRDVLDALKSDPSDELSLKRICLRLGMSWSDFRRSMMRLALRQPGDEPPKRRRSKP